jgi:hypothetical protein
VERPCVRRKTQNNQIMRMISHSFPAVDSRNRATSAVIGFYLGLLAIGFSLSAQTTPPDPAALVLDVGIKIGTNRTVELSWADLGSNYVYTVTSNDSMAGCDWFPCPSADGWPIRATFWVDLRPAGAGSRTYRVVAVLPGTA